MRPAERFHVGLKDDGGADLIHKGFVSPRHTRNAALQYGLVCQDGGEPLVVFLYGHVGESGGEFPQENLDVSGILGWLAVGLGWFPDDDSLYGFIPEILLKKGNQLVGCHRGKSVRYNL